MNRIAFLFPLLLLTAAMPTAVAIDFEPEILTLIQQDLGSNCWMEPTSRDNWMIGNNGAWMERWTVDSCHGKRVYSVRYYPPEEFPERGSPYEIIRARPS